MDCVGDWSSSDDEGSRSGGKKKSRRRRRGDGGDDGWDDEGAVRCGPNSFGGCFAFLFGPSEEVVRRRRKQRERDERRKARTALLHPGTVEDGSDAGVRVSDDEGYNSMFDDWFDEEEGDRGTDYPDWHPARASLKGEGFFANRARVYATWKPRRPIDISFTQPSVLLMSQMAFVFSQPMWRSLATFQRVDPALCAEPEPPHVTGERPDVYERLKEEARVYRVSHQTRYAYAAWSEDMLGAFLGCVFATAAWSCALRDPRNRRRRRRRKIETFFFFGVLRGWHDAASAHQARVESRRVNLELMAFLAKQQRQKRWEASLNETWDDIKAVSDGTKGAAGKTAGTGKNVARAASSEAKEDGGKSVSFTRQIVKIGKDATNAAADALGAGDDDADVGEGDAGRDVGSGDDGSGTGDGTDGVTGPAVKLRDDDGTGYGQTRRVDLFPPPSLRTTRRRRAKEGTMISQAGCLTSSAAGSGPRGVTSTTRRTRRPCTTRPWRAPSKEPFAGIGISSKDDALSGPRWRSYRSTTALTKGQNPRRRPTRRRMIATGQSAPYPSRGSRRKNKT